MRILSAAVFAGLLTLASLTAQAADNNFPTPGGATAPGAVNMCLDGAGHAIACVSYSYTNITTDTTTTVKSGPGILHTVCINTPAATGTIQIYDNTAASGTKIGLITSFASGVVCQTYDVGFATGLTIVTATAAPDITVSWR